MLFLFRKQTTFRQMKKTYSFGVRPQDVDFQYRITPAALTDILLTTAGMNADENGFGIRDLNNDDCSWVLLRMAVEVGRFPEQYEKIKVETWVEEVGRASTTRNFRITDATGKLIAKAVSSWAMINVMTRRAQDLIALEGIHAFANGESNEMEKPVRLQSVETEPAGEFNVKYSHIDINGHTNSIRYVEWITDCFSLDTYKNKQINRFEINYINEILFGDKVSIHMQETETDDFRFELRKNGSTACKARVLFG